MNYRNINDLNTTILKNLSKIPRNIDLIVGIPRSGMLPANLLSLYLNKPYTDLQSFQNGHIYKAGARGQFFDISEFKNILIVDDSVSSGSAMNECKASLAGLTNKFNLQYCAVYVVPGKQKLVDYFLEFVAFPRYFQWNIFNHTTLEKACFDIDGVLCVDPTPEQNDDGEKYLDFIRNAPPLFIPGCKIGTIVTSRLEKYRNPTETWLKANNVKYNELVMLDLPDMEARQRANNHGEHKAKEYMKKPYILFIESDYAQSVEINRISKKPVLCTENFEMIYKSESLLYNFKSGKHLPFLRKGALQVRDKLRQLSLL